MFNNVWIKYNRKGDCFSTDCSFSRLIASERTFKWSMAALAVRLTPTCVFSGWFKEMPDIFLCYSMYV